MRPFIVCLAACALLFVIGCANTQPYVAPEARGWKHAVMPPDSLRTYQVYLVGDAGEPSPTIQKPVLRLLTGLLDSAGPQSAVVFLGDNIYPRGLVDKDDPGRSEAESRLLDLLCAVEHFEGRLVFIPGNHDWDFRQRYGDWAVQRQEEFVEKYLKRGNVFLPDNGLPGPVEVPLTDSLVLIAMDTQWWLHSGGKLFGETEEYRLRYPEDFMLQINDVVQRHAEQQVLVVGHHPLFSNGMHAGHHPLKHHLFPLTAKFKWAYVPLPVVGTLYVAYSRLIGGSQEFAGWRYQDLRKRLLPIFEQHERLVYASGHDHALEYFDEGAQHYLVSGAASKVDYVAPGRGATFTASERGFMELDYYADGQVWLTVWSTDDDGEAGVVLFRKQLEQGHPTVQPMPPVVVVPPAF